MTDRLSEIEARLDAATPGGWAMRRYYGATWVHAAYDAPDGGVTVAGDFVRTDDADLIAHAPDDLRYLLGRVRELEAAQSNST